MALTHTFTPVAPPPGLAATSSNYRTAYDLTHQYAPDLAPELFRIRSRGSLNGFLSANAQEEGVTADRFYWGEEGERHPILTGLARSGNVLTSVAHPIRLGIKVMIQNATDNAWCLARVSAVAANTFTCLPYGDADLADYFSETTAFSVFTVGSEWLKGSNGQQSSLELDLDIKSNKLIIETDTYKNNNSDLSSRAWLHIDGNYYWVDAQFEETTQRFMDELEISMLTSETTDAGSAMTGTYEGTEGYFQAIRNRGITHTGVINTTAEWEIVIKTLDKVHAEDTYIGYLSRTQSLTIDKWLASLSAYYASTGTNYGAFSNSGIDGKEMSMQMGFSGFSWGDYSFMKQTWNVLKDPTKFGNDIGMAASGTVNGVFFPHGNTSVSDPISGAAAKKVPYLTLMYKEMPGYSRKLESFFIGSGRIATATTDGDYLKLNLRSERALRVVGARKHMIIPG